MTNPTKKSNLKTRVALGMSGGVDSTVSINILQRAGYEVHGFTFIFSNLEKNGAVPRYALEAKMLAEKFGIKHYIVDEQKAFGDEVLQNFENEYLRGRTPFPCALCNKKMKWHALKRQMEVHNCQKMATGHYAKILKSDAGTYIKRHHDATKDQSFFLWGIPPSFIPHIILPLQNHTKQEVKQIAADLGLVQLKKKQESFGICFSPDGDYRKYLKTKILDFENKVSPGNFMSEKGEILGRHKGIVHYTIGQKKGLEHRSTKRLYVKRMDVEHNTIILAEHQDVLYSTIHLADYVMRESDYDSNARYEVQFTYRGRASYGTLTQINGLLKLNLEEPEFAVALGQTAVLYKNDVVVAGGFIESAE